MKNNILILITLTSLIIYCYHPHNKEIEIQLRQITNKQETMNKAILNITEYYKAKNEEKNEAKKEKRKNQIQNEIWALKQLMKHKKDTIVQN